MVYRQVNMGCDTHVEVTDNSCTGTSMIALQDSNKNPAVHTFNQ